MLDGAEFETRSAALLRGAGLRIIARNFRCRRGEIDLVATDGQRLIFAEVRARASGAYGGAAASVDAKKQCKIRRCAESFMSRHREWGHLPCRFDVIAWERSASSGATPRWIRGAFGS